MRIVYRSPKIETQCKNINEARRLFGGNNMLAMSLLARMQALESAAVIHDIIVQPQFRFHNLSNKGKHNNLKGCFAIDVKTHKEPWRIILRPIDDDDKPYIPCDIDEISKLVKSIEIMEVSKHYE